MQPKQENTMADYYLPTVIQQPIPQKLISPFEELLLGAVFEHEEEDATIYYFASNTPSDLPSVDRHELIEALAATPQKSRLKTFAQNELDEQRESPHVDLDFTASIYGSDAYLVILQDIVRRSRGALPYLTIASAWTCSKMRPNGFGGQATIITPRAIRHWSTHAYFQAFIARFEKKARRGKPL
jgi:hypothetical protein